MVELNTETTAEALTYYEADNIPFVHDITTKLNNGTYIKLSTKEYLFVDYSRVVKSETVATPQNFGFRNNNTIIVLEFSYNEA